MTASADETRFWLFGGSCAEGRTAELHRFDATTHVWTLVGLLLQRLLLLQIPTLSPNSGLWTIWQDELHYATLRCTTSASPAQVKTAAPVPRPREGHAAAVIGQYFVISGGVGDATDGTGGHVYLGDTWALDTTAPTSWECLDDGAWAASLVWPKHIVATCFFIGKKLVTLQPNRSALHDPLAKTTANGSISTSH